MFCSNDNRQKVARIFFLNQQSDKCYDFEVENPTNGDSTENCPILDLDDFYECKDDLVGGGLADEDQKNGDNFSFIPYGLINTYAGLIVVVFTALFAYYLILYRLRKILSSPTTSEAIAERRKSSCPRKSFVENENSVKYRVENEDNTQLPSTYSILDENSRAKYSKSDSDQKSHENSLNMEEAKPQHDGEKSHLEGDDGGRTYDFKLENFITGQRSLDYEDDHCIAGLTVPKNSLIEFTDGDQWMAGSKSSNYQSKINFLANDAILEIEKIRLLSDQLVEDQNLAGNPKPWENSESQGQSLSEQHRQEDNSVNEDWNMKNYGISDSVTDISRMIEKLDTNQLLVDPKVTDQIIVEVDQSYLNDSTPKSSVQELDDTSVELISAQSVSIIDDRNPYATMQDLGQIDEHENTENDVADQLLGERDHRPEDRKFDQSLVGCLIGRDEEVGSSLAGLPDEVSDKKDEITVSLDWTSHQVVQNEKELEKTYPNLQTDAVQEAEQWITSQKEEGEVKKYADSTKMIEVNFDATLTSSQKILPKKLEDQDQTVLEKRDFTNLDANVQVFVEFFNNFCGSISVESRIQSIIQFEASDATFPVISEAEVLSLAFSLKHDEDAIVNGDKGSADRKEQLVDQTVSDRSTFKIDNCENVTLNCELFAKYGSSVSDERTALCTIFHDKQESSADYFAVAKSLPIQQSNLKHDDESSTTNSDIAHPAVNSSLDILPRESYDISVNLHNKFGDNGCTVEVVLLRQFDGSADRFSFDEDESRLISVGTKVKIERNVDSCSRAPKIKNLEKLLSETESIHNKNYDIVQKAEILVHGNDENLIDQQQPMSSDYDYDSAELADNTTAPEIDTFLEIDMDNGLMLQDQDVYDENSNLRDYFADDDGQKSRDLDVQKAESLEKSRDPFSIEGDVEVKATVLLKKGRAVFNSQEECDIVLSQSEKESSEISNVDSILGLFNTKKCEDVIHRVDTLEAVADIMRRAGLESSNLIFGIDYTASNKYQGEICFDGKSLHSIEPGILNPYQQVISILGKTLAHFISEDGYLTAYGFGDEKTKDQSTFPLGDEPFCSSFQEVLQIYNTVTPNVKLGGPTNFAPLIYGAMELCKKLKEYHILVIVADGQVTNERATRRAIVEACRYPLSIIVVGVGDGPWDMMKVFDDMLPRRPWDNFHFIEFNEIVEHYSADGNFETAFAVQSLLEIPDQYKIIKEMGMLDSDSQNE